MTSSHPDVLLRGRRRWYIYVHRFQRVGQLICRGVVATFLAACEVSGKYFWRLNLHLDNWKWGGFGFPGNRSRVMMKAWWWVEWSQLRRGTPCMFVRMYVCTCTCTVQNTGQAWVCKFSSHYATAGLIYIRIDSRYRQAIAHVTSGSVV